MLKARPQIRVVLATAPAKNAERIARTLLDERLIACANLLPRVRSLYRWKGKVERGVETLMMMKTSSRKVAPLLKRFKQLHPYEVPEFLSLPVDAGNAAYLKWVHAECT